ncbi:MAG: hypothetical protein ACR2QW_04735, partial [bacterium]
MASKLFTLTKSSGPLLLLVWMMSTAVFAQETLDSAATPAPDSNVTRDQLIALIANEVLLAPGIGLRNIRLGEPLEEVQNRLGPPTRILKNGVFRPTYTLTYQLDGGTLVAL